MRMLSARSSLVASALLPPAARLAAMLRPRLVTASVRACSWRRRSEKLTRRTARATRVVMRRLSLTLSGSRNSRLT